MRRFFAILTLVTLAGYSWILFGLQYRGTFMGSTPTLLMATYLGGSTLLVSVAALVAGWRSRKRELLQTGLKGLAIAASLMGLLATIPLGRHLLHRDIERAKSFCDHLVAEQVVRQDEKGRYPSGEAAFMLGLKRPRLLGRRFYYPSDDRSRFEFVIWFDFDLRWVYDSRTGRWRIRG